VVTISAQRCRGGAPARHWMDPGALGSLGVGTLCAAAKLVHPQRTWLLRRRLLRHDRLRYGDGQPVRVLRTSEIGNNSP